MIKFIPALCAVAFATKDYHYADYDGAWYDDYVDDYKYEHGHDPHYYENPVDDADYHDDHYDESHDPHYGDVPTGDFWHQVDDFDPWEEIWGQEEYEYRLAQEASLMVALEALREDLIHLDHDIDDLDDCISHNDDDISENDLGIAHNDAGISDNDHEISDQEHRIERCQRACRRHQAELDEDRDFLVLHCQQFAFAKDLVGACADILTCRGTDLAYRADVFNGHGHYHEPVHHYEPEPHHEEPTDYHVDEEHHDDHYHGYDHGHYH